MRTSPQSTPDVKPLIDEIVHDTFALQARSNSPPMSPRASVAKLPPYVVRGQRPRPHVTVSYFQSLDGAVVEGAGAEATHLAGRLRASHDAVLTDRLARPDGNGNRPASPKTILVDEHLTASQEAHSDLGRVTVVTHADLQGSLSAQRLADAGAQLLFVPSMALADVLEALFASGIRKLVVESGIVHRFIQESLFDKLIMVIVPVFAPAAAAPLTGGTRPRLMNVNYEVLGTDIVVTAEPELEQPCC